MSLLLSNIPFIPKIISAFIMVFSTFEIYFLLIKTLINHRINMHRKAMKAIFLEIMTRTKSGYDEEGKERPLNQGHSFLIFMTSNMTTQTYLN
jgi:hypothetical protein